MIETDKLKETLQREVDQLAQLRDDLKVRARLAKADARDELDRLESSWLRIQEELKRIGEHTKESAGEIEVSMRKLIGDLKVHYQRIKGQL